MEENNINNEIKNRIIFELYKNNLVKKGEFILKSGKKSNIYFDLRALVSYPKTLKVISNLMYDLILEKKEIFDLICGVPYGAISIASLISLKSNIPMIFIRKEAKNYGAKKMVEGNYSKNQNCILVEDVITSGKSLLETIEKIENEGIKIATILCLLDREEGGVNMLNSKGYKVLSLLKQNEILNFKKLEEYNIEQILKNTENAKTKELITIIKNKKTNICLACDLTKTNEILELANNLGEDICILKLHSDIINDFSNSFILKLKEISNKKNFLLWEDRKFSDIGSVVSSQFNEGIYKISSWADLITVHSVAGSKTIDSIKTEKTGIIIVSQMSSEGNLMDINYQYETYKMLDKYNKYIVGLVTQNGYFKSKRHLIFSPGVNLEIKKDEKGQQYNKPKELIKNVGTNIFVIGRGIYNSKNPKETIEHYKKNCINTDE